MKIRRKRKLYDILQFSFCGVNFNQAHFVRYGLLALKNEILPAVYQKQGIQTVELDPVRGLSHALCKL